MTNCVPLLGLRFAAMDTAAAAAWIASRPAGAPFGYVVTPNADHLVRLARRPELRPVYQDALLRLLDSRVVAFVARALGLPAPAVVPGSDLSALLLARHVQPDERVVVLGLQSRWIAPLVHACRLAPPWHFNPPVGFERDPHAVADAVHFVLAHPARFIFIALGSPRQELLAAAIAATGRATGTGLCIGASLEFLCGAHRRAPCWMQHVGMEWLFRLACDPRRLTRRYLLDAPAILPLLLQERRVGKH